jgi:hypothetical protein
VLSLFLPIRFFSSLDKNQRLYSSLVYLSHLVTWLIYWNLWWAIIPMKFNSFPFVWNLHSLCPEIIAVLKKMQSGMIKQPADKKINLKNHM